MNVAKHFIFLLLFLPLFAFPAYKQEPKDVATVFDLMIMSIFPIHSLRRDLEAPSINPLFEKAFKEDEGDIKVHLQEEEYSIEEALFWLIHLKGHKNREKSCRLFNCYCDDFDVDVAQVVVENSSEKKTLLGEAICRPRSDIVEILLKRGVDVNTRIDEDKLPLQLAVKAMYKINREDFLDFGLVSEHDDGDFRKIVWLLLDHEARSDLSSVMTEECRWYVGPRVVKMLSDAGAIADE